MYKGGFIWERGQRRRLCHLFGQCASDLGLLKELHGPAATRPHPHTSPAPFNHHPPLVSSGPGSSRLSSLPLIGRATEIGGHLPYQPLVHILRQHIEAEKALKIWLSATWLSELSQILPERRTGRTRLGTGFRAPRTLGRSSGEALVEVARTHVIWANLRREHSDKTSASAK